MKKAALILGISFIVLGFFIPAAAIVVTFMLPETFTSSAKILPGTNKPPRFETTVAMITSRRSLDHVVGNLNLTREWGRRYKQPDKLPLAQCSLMLSKMIQINLPRGSRLIEIKVHSHDRNEAAHIANELAAVYLRETPGATLVQAAQPGATATRPNKRLNIILGVFTGATLLIVGLGLLVASRISANRR